MNKKIMNVLILMLTYVTISFAGQTPAGNVVFVSAYSENYQNADFVGGFSFGITSCPNVTFLVKGTDPAVQSYLAILLSAKADSQTVSVDSISPQKYGNGSNVWWETLTKQIWINSK